METARPETAFILAGGGSLGAVQVGMLRVSLKAELNPTWSLAPASAQSMEPTLREIQLCKGFPDWSASGAGSNAPTSFRGLGAGSLALFAGTVISYHPTGSDVFSTTICRIAIWRTRSSRCTSSQPTFSPADRGVVARSGDASGLGQRRNPCRFCTGGNRQQASLRRSRCEQYAREHRYRPWCTEAYCSADGICMCARTRAKRRAGNRTACDHAPDRETARDGAGTDQAANSVSHSTYRLSARCFTI